MQLTREKIGEELVVKAVGRLDASWADLFMENMLKEVRSGEHHLLIDASEMSYVSSAGIRALLLLQKELFTVKGGFKILHASGMVRQTLALAGFEQWLQDEAPAPSEEKGKQMPSPAKSGKPGVFDLQWNGVLTARVVTAWNPWEPVDIELCRKLVFDADGFALGIGSAADTVEESLEVFGEFLSVKGAVAMQPPDEHSRPDYLIPEKAFFPELYCIQAILCRGEMSHLLRFSPQPERPIHRLSNLIEDMMAITEASAVGFVVAGEIEGLVGASLIRSPGRLSARTSLEYPAIREWLSFCGERVFAGEQALIGGVAVRGGGVDPARPTVMQPLAGGALHVHAHAAVFPYQPLQNGRIDLMATVQRLFNGPSPRAVMHLVDDARTGVGLGESALLRGACWCAPLSNPEVLA